MKNNEIQPSGKLGNLRMLSFPEDQTHFSINEEVELAAIMVSHYDRTTGFIPLGMFRHLTSWLISIRIGIILKKQACGRFS